MGGQKHGEGGPGTALGSGAGGGLGDDDDAGGGDAAVLDTTQWLAPLPLSSVVRCTRVSEQSKEAAR